MPKLSIVIAVVSGDYDLESIERACDGMDIEVILVSANPVPVSKAGQVVRVEPGCTEEQMRSIGFRHATGERVAVLGDRYGLSETWVRAAIAGQGDVTVGCIAPAADPSYAGWAIYFAEYSHVAPPGHAFLPAGNAVYSNMTGEHCCFDPDLTAFFAKPPGLKQYLMERYRESRKWAAEQQSPQPLLSAASRIALPLLLLLRRARNLASRRRYRVRFLAALPYLLLFGVVEAAGEIAGFLAGGSRSK